MDLAHRYVKSRTWIDNAWLGLAWNAAGDRVYTSAAKENVWRNETKGGFTLVSSVQVSTTPTLASSTRRNVSSLFHARHA